MCLENMTHVLRFVLGGGIRFLVSYGGRSFMNGLNKNRS